MVNVEYRLAPEYPFPASIDDGCTVARWVLDHKTVVGKSQHSTAENQLGSTVLRGFHRVLTLRLLQSVI